MALDAQQKREQLEQKFKVDLKFLKITNDDLKLRQELLEMLISSKASEV